MQNSFGPGNSAFHQFNPAVVTSCTTTPCVNGSFSSAGTATGIGDVDLRAKYEVYQGEHFGFATGVDVRLPTGDEQNLLGSGAIGVRPFGIVSYSARVSPHAEIGYELNGKSILAGDFVATPTTKGGLPDRFVYIVGADVAIVKRLTASSGVWATFIWRPTIVFDPLYRFRKVQRYRLHHPDTRNYPSGHRRSSQRRLQHYKCLCRLEVPALWPFSHHRQRSDQIRRWRSALYGCTTRWRIL